MTASPSPSRPVQLQVNLSGSWRTVLHFDAGDDAVATQVQQAVQMLHEAVPRPGWRIATDDQHKLVLRHLGNNTYGLWIDRQP